MIETDRLTIEDISPADGAFMLALVNTEGRLRNIGDRHVHSLEDADRYIRKLVQTENLSYRVVRLNTDRTPVGIVSFLKRSYLEHFDLGFAFLPEQMGKGYAFEAAKAVRDQARNDPAHRVILATTLPSNLPSIKLLTRLGFHFSKELEVDGIKLNLYAYGEYSAG